MTTQSSTNYDRTTSTNRSSNFPVSPDWPDCQYSYSQTQRENRPWWAVQLSGRFTVSRVYIKAGMLLLNMTGNYLRTNEPIINTYSNVSFS